MAYKQPLGVSDNKSYKDQYHFKETFPDGSLRTDLPSINVDPKINTSIKENPYRSNVEIEKDEVILKPDLSALFKAKGKTHKQGGIDVMLAPESFVFSDDKTLSFTEKEQKLFEFKTGGTYKKDKNTPADVLKRNIDTKHYNTLVSNIADVKKDDLAKKSSMLMLEKYIGTLGNIAYLQEAKKDFPTGIPDFAMGSAPIYDPELKNEIMAQKQYAKYGGQISGNPYMQVGGRVRAVKDKDGNKIWVFPNGNKRVDFTNGRTSMEMADGTVTVGNIVDHNLFSPDKYKPDNFVRGARPPRQDAGNFFTTPGMQMTPAFNYMQPVTPAELQARRMASASAPVAPPPTVPGRVIPSGDVNGTNNPNGHSGVPRINPPNSGVPPVDEPGLPRIPRATPELNTPQKVQGPTITGAPPSLIPGQVEGPVDQGRDINWQFSPWQRVSQGYNAFKYASARRYMPMRSQLNPSYAEAALVNPEQSINDMQSAANQAYQGINTLSPILRNAQSSAAYGDLLNRMPGVRSQYDNQNASIMNQNRAMNNQITNNARAVNMQNDQTYYQQSVIGQQNFNNLQSYLGDKYMSDLMTDVQDNQSLAFNLATLDNPAYNYNFRTMGFDRNKKDIRDVRQTSRTQEDILELTEQLKQQGYSDKLIGDIIKSKTFQSARIQKKGGSTNPYK